MSKKFCRNGEELAKKNKGKKKNYLCGKCQKKSRKEKWCYKPEEIKQ